MSAVHETDVAIIGAGPVGLFAVFECGMLGMRCHVVDALDTTGGQCAALYPEKPIYDIPGYPRIDAAELPPPAGVGPFGPNRPPLPGIAAYEGRSVFYLVKRREDFRGKRVVVAGGGGSAGGWAVRP